MTALTRKTMTRGAPMKPLECPVICDICGKLRAHGSHRKCSRARQIAMAELKKKP